MEEDLRVSDFYLTEEEKCDWHNNNILYNTLWFAQKKFRPDIEYSKGAISSYKEIPFYNNWGCTNGRRKVLISPNSHSITADLMTGWWNPFKYFLKLTIKGRENAIEELLTTVPKKNDIGVTIEWVKKKNNAEIEDCIAMLDFLNVVYTSGNIIPAPINWRGQGIDSWEYKLHKIFQYQDDSASADTNAKAWDDYINDNFQGSRQSFIEENKLQMYFNGDDYDDRNIVSFWGEDKPSFWPGATTKQWGSYFKKAKELIYERNTCLQALHNNKIEKD